MTPIARGPIPEEWFRHGAPPERLAAYAEGMCPVHLTPLDPGMMRIGGKGTMPLRWIPAGRCDACRAWWHRPFDRMAELVGEDGFAATWDTAEYAV